MKPKEHPRYRQSYMNRLSGPATQTPEETLAELLAQRSKLVSLMARGESAIEFENRRTEFRSYSELERALSRIDEIIAGIANPDAGQMRRVRYVASDKDLG